MLLFLALEHRQDVVLNYLCGKLGRDVVNRYLLGILRWLRFALSLGAELARECRILMTPGALSLRPKDSLACKNLRESILSHSGLIGLRLTEPARGLVVTVTSLSRLKTHVLLDKLRTLLVRLLMQCNCADRLRGDDRSPPTSCRLDAPR